MAKTFRRNNDDDDEELLQDGQRMRVPMMMRDSQTLHDGRGGTPGHRPGYAYTHDAAARERVAAAHERYQQTLCDAWRGPINEMANEANDTAIADAAAHAARTPPRPMSQVYELYDEELRNAFKSPR